MLIKICQCWLWVSHLTWTAVSWVKVLFWFDPLSHPNPPYVQLLLFKLCQLTSSFAPVIISKTTRGHCFTINVNTGHFLLLDLCSHFFLNNGSCWMTWDELCNTAKHPHILWWTAPDLRVRIWYEKMTMQALQIMSAQVKTKTWCGLKKKKTYLVPVTQHAT